MPVLSAARAPLTADVSPAEGVAETSMDGSAAPSGRIGAVHRRWKMQTGRLWWVAGVVWLLVACGEKAKAPLPEGHGGVTASRSSVPFGT